jgi:hypothetical protein
MNPTIFYSGLYQNGSPGSPSRYHRGPLAYRGVVLQSASPSYGSTFLFGVDSLLSYIRIEVAYDKGLLASFKHASKIETGRCLVDALADAELVA